MVGLCCTHDIHFATVVYKPLCAIYIYILYEDDDDYYDDYYDDDGDDDDDDDDAHLKDGRFVYGIQWCVAKINQLDFDAFYPKLF